jgi:AraC family transcriptional regulator
MQRSYVSDRNWAGLRTHYAWLTPHEGATVTRPNQIGISFSAHRSLVQSHAGREREADVARGALFVTGADPITWIRVREHTEALEMYPDLGFLAGLADLSPSGIAIEPSLGATDPVILAVASRFRMSHAADAPIGDIEASELSLRVALRLLQRHTGVNLPAGSFHGRLDERRLRRVCDFIETHLGERLDISRLASEAALSSAHFARAFRRTTGMTPQKYVTSRRMARAKEKLIAGEATVASAAADAGFSNLNHFRRLFRAEYGTAPGNLRA